MKTTKERREKLLLALILGAALIIRLWHIDWGLPEVYEEAIPFSVAWKFWNWGRAGLDMNPHFFNYPAFTFYLNFFVQAVYYGVGYVVGMFPSLNAFHNTYLQNPTSFIILSRLISVVVDVGTVYCIFQLGAHTTDRQIGFLSAILAAISLPLIRQSHLINVDTALTFFTILSLYCIHKVVTARDAKSYITAGVTIGLAAASKYTGALLMLVFVVGHFHNGDSFKKNLRGSTGRKLISSMTLATVVFLAVNPHIILNWEEFLRDFSFEESHMTSGHLGIDPSMSTGEYYVLHVLPSSLGPVLSIAVVVSILLGVIRKQKLPREIVVFVITYLGVILSWRMRAERYLLPLIPILVLVGSIGMMRVFREFTAWRMKRFAAGILISRPFRYASVSICVLVVIVQPVLALLVYERSHSLPDTRAVAKEWIKTHIPRGSFIATVPLGIEFSGEMYPVFPIPFLSVNAERLAAFYDPRWYEDFDLVIGSDFEESCGNAGLQGQTSESRTNSARDRKR